MEFLNVVAIGFTQLNNLEYFKDESLNELLDMNQFLQIQPVGALFFSSWMNKLHFM